MSQTVLDFVAIGISVLAILVSLFNSIDIRRICRRVQRSNDPNSILQQYADWRWPTEQTNPKENGNA